MTRETKVGLLVGMGVILLIGIIVSDHLSMAQKQTPPDMTGYAPQTQNSLAADGSGIRTLPTPPAQAAVLPPPDMPLPAPRQAAPQPAQPSPRAAPPQTTLAQSQPVLPSSHEASSYSHADARDNAGDALAMQPARPASPGVIHLGPTQTAVPAFQDVALVSPATVTPRSTQGPQPMIHYVQRGETLYAIAARYYNDGDLWPVLRHYNPQNVRPDNSVLIGARLEIPHKALLPELLRQMPSASQILVPDDAPAAPARTASPQPARVASAVRTLKVERGDTLSGLAARHLGSADRWNDLFMANRDQMDKPNDLRAGMTLKLPADAALPASSSTSTTRRASGPTQYTVREGDTLFKIAQAHMGDGHQWQALYQANKQVIKNPNHLPAGLTIRIPAPSSR